MKSSLKTLAVVSLFTAASGFAFAASATPGAEKFASKAAEGDFFEIETSKLAVEKSQNADIRQFAQQMIDDHSKADQGLKQAVDTSGIDKSKVGNFLTSDDQLTLNKLKNLSGNDFDKRYVSAQKDAHKDAVKLFKDYSENGDNAALKNFAGQTLPTLQSHKDHIEKISEAMK